MEGSRFRSVRKEGEGSRYGIDPSYPRVLIKKIGRNKAFIEWRNTERFKGRAAFIDALTLAGALSGASLSLERACDAFSILARMGSLTPSATSSTELSMRTASTTAGRTKTRPPASWSDCSGSTFPSRHRGAAREDLLRRVDHG